jgi:ABC-type uncharacterized transport system substrate-binding protein
VGGIIMKKTVLMLFLFIFFCGALLFACTNNEEDSEPGAIESFTEETADEITSSIKKPLNKARAVKNTGQDRMKNVDDMVKE